MIGLPLLLCCTGIPAIAAPAKPSANVVAKSNVLVIPYLLAVGRFITPETVLWSRATLAPERRNTTGRIL
jgi:hypothetical protein